MNGGVEREEGVLSLIPFPSGAASITQLTYVIYGDGMTLSIV